MNSSSEHIGKSKVTGLILGLVTMVIGLFSFFSGNSSGYAVAESDPSEAPVVASLHLMRSGRVAYNHIKLGAFVEKGQILLELETGSCLFQLQETRGRIRQLEGELVVNQTRLGQGYRLGHHDTKTLDQAYERRNHLEKQLLILREQQAKLTGILEESRLRAPYDGMIGMLVECPAGSMVEAGFSPAQLMALQDETSPM